MTAATLYYHPLASFCWKVLLALYERDLPFTPQIVDHRDPAQAAALAALWPVAKFPVLRQGDTVWPETSIIIEHLEQAHPGALPRLIPVDDPAQALTVRLWDRFFDLHIHDPMQRIVADRLRPEAARDPQAVREAEARLDTAYDAAEAHLAAGQPFAAGADFSMADCAAFPALFYADVIHPIGARPRLSAYLERLSARPATIRVLNEARPWFRFYPFADRLPAHLRD